MRAFRIPLGALVAAAAALAPAPGTQAAPTRVPMGEPPAVGSAPPALGAQRIRGPDPVDLGRLHGRVVLLDFWATWCGACRFIMPQLDALHRAHHGSGLSVIGISPERRRVIEAHLGEMRRPVGYTLAGDGDGTTLRRYGVRSLPMLVLIDRGGKVRAVAEGGGPELVRLIELIPRLVGEAPPPSAR